jgi:hypothetical protein
LAKFASVSEVIDDPGLYEFAGHSKPGSFTVMIICTVGGALLPRWRELGEWV